MNQVTLPCTDVARSAAFYRQLGLSQIVEDLPNYARFELPEGASTLSLHRVNSSPGSPGVVVYFECRDLDERVARLKEQGVVFESGPVDQPWLWREAILRDPDGNTLCLFWAGTNRKNPPWRLRTEE